MFDLSEKRQWVFFVFVLFTLISGNEFFISTMESRHTYAYISFYATFAVLVVVVVMSLQESSMLAPHGIALCACTLLFIYLLIQARVLYGGGNDDKDTEKKEEHFLL